MTARILIADDEDSLRWVLEKGLRQAGYEVTGVKDGAAAIRPVEAEAFDLVFLDVRRPGVDALAAPGERRRDIPMLVEHFLAKHGPELGERGAAPEALDRLVGHDWPGNVRELENVVQRAIVMATTGVILPEHLPIGPVSAAASVAVDASIEEIIEKKLLDCVRGLRERASANLYDLMVGLVEKPLLRAVLRETGGNQVRAAQILGINRNTLRKKLTEHGVDPERL